MKAWKHKEASKELMSKQRKGVKKSEETKARMRAAQQLRQERTRQALALAEKLLAQQKIVAVVGEPENKEVKNEQ